MSLIIKNFTELATSKLRRDALEIINSGIESVLPENLLRSKIQYNEIKDILTIDNKDINLKNKRLFVIGFGKASVGMAKIIEEIIPANRITAGMVIANQNFEDLTTIEIHEASHPIPDQRGIEGARTILGFKEEYSINGNDVFLCLISGGGSTLFTYPVFQVSLDELKQTNKILISSGASITEINCVRKHLSLVKGGRLAYHFKPATIISLIISDIIGNPLDAIASGPTVPDPTTFQDTYDILIKYDIFTKVPDSVKRYVEVNINKTDFETPKHLDNCHNFIIGDNQVALEGMFEKAEVLGYDPLIVNSRVSGEPGFEVKKRAHYIKIGKYSDYDVLLLAGETTPVLPEYHGIGGRNQHFILENLIQMKEFDGDWVLASVSTDGSDYQKDVAGGIIDNNSLNTSQKKGLDANDYIDGYDSNSFLSELGGSLVVIGKTGTNVGDLIVYILKNNNED